MGKNVSPQVRELRGAPDEQQAAIEFVCGVGRGAMSDKSAKARPDRRTGTPRTSLRFVPCVTCLRRRLSSRRAELRLQTFPGLFEGIQRSRCRGQPPPSGPAPFHHLLSRPRGWRCRE